MTQDRFLQLIENPDQLSGISLEELRTLVLAYPYAQNLRYLLAIKASQIKHPEEARFIQNAAACSLDRKCLFMAILPARLVPETLVLPEKEPVLELKPIETVKKELEALAPAAPVVKNETAGQIAVAIPTAPPVPVKVDEAIPLAENMEKQSFQGWFSQFHPPNLKKAEVPPPNPVSIPSEPEEPEPPGRKKTEKAQPLTGIAQALAEKSVSENEGVMSETLAKLLARQGYRDKAIQMYQRLSLVFPEKSDYFAAQFEKLKK